MSSAPDVLDDLQARLNARMAVERQAMPEILTCERHGEYGRREGERASWDCTLCQADAVEAERVWRAALLTARRYDAADVPWRFRSARFENFVARTSVHRAARNAIASWSTSPAREMLVLIGPPGVGKTHLACSLIASLSPRCSTRYVNAPDLLAEIRDSYRQRKRYSDEPGERTEREILAELNEPALLVVDEIGAGRSSTWEQNILAGIVDTRYREGRHLALLGNLKPSELKDALGERGADRIAEVGLVIPLPGPSFRAQAAGKRCEQADSITQPSTSLTVRLTRKGIDTECVIYEDGRRSDGGSTR